MGKAELTRMYYLLCEGRYNLPPTKLLKLLPKKTWELFEGAQRYGIGSGMSNLEQLTNLYMAGSESGIEATESEFKGLLCAEIRQALCNNTDINTQTYVEYAGMLADYYKAGSIEKDQEILPFDADAPEIERFSTGLPALDKLCGGGIYKCLMTLLGDPGNGKSSLALWIAANWPYGPVSFFEPNEMGPELMLNKVKSMGIEFRDPKPLFHFGSYGPETVLNYINDNPDPNRLVICDSLSAMCGLGDSPESRARYGRFYQKAIEIKEKSKLLIYTTHLKRGASGEGISDGGGSSMIEKVSRIIVSVAKEDTRPDMTNNMSLYAIKNSMAMSGIRQKFVFDLDRNRFIKLLDEEGALEDELEGILNG